MAKRKTKVFTSDKQRRAVMALLKKEGLTTVNVARPLSSSFERGDNKLRDLADRWDSGSGAGFGVRDLDFYFVSKTDANKFMTKVKRSFGKKAKVKINPYDDPAELGTDFSMAEEYLSASDIKKLFRKVRAQRGPKLRVISGGKKR